MDRLARLSNFWMISGSLLASCLVCALFVSGVVVTQKATSEKERDALVSMTAAFMKAYAQGRGDNSDVPPKFRRKALAFFNGISGNGDFQDLTMRMPGLPGSEVMTREQDERIAGLITRFQETGRTGAVTELGISGGRLIGRTITPSIANDETCIACHNEISPDRVWKAGDVMGAFVVEDDLTGSILQAGGWATALFVLCFSGSLFYLAHERKRVSEVVETLEKQVEVERQKRWAEEKALFLASHDSLTGVLNRNIFQTKVALALKGDSEVVMMLIDIDDFKQVNDTHGHDAGDHLLKCIAMRLRESILRHSGIVARLGGDEFAVIIPDVPDDLEKDELAGAIIADVREPVRYDGSVLYPHISIGIASTLDLGARTETALMKAADYALYHAKENGRNTYRIYDEMMARQIARRRELAMAIPAALETKAFELYFQPQVDLKNGCVHGFEALSRWRKDDTLLSPLEFIPIAEDTGNIRQIDMQVLSRAARQLKAWVSAGHDTLTVSVNMSAHHFNDEHFADKVLATLKQWDVPQGQLVLEFTETTIMRNWEHVKKTIERFQKCGVPISLDDFGTGYSSLSYLRKIDADEIKIDKSFITDIEKSSETRFIFDSVADIIRGLGKKLVVEGIETVRQRDIVTDFGAEIGQGYLFGRPMPPEDADAWLAANSAPPARAGQLAN